MDTEPFQYLIAVGMVLTILVVMKFALEMALRVMSNPSGRIDPGPSRQDETERLWNRHVDACARLKTLFVSPSTSAPVPQNDGPPWRLSSALSRD